MRGLLLAACFFCSACGSATDRSQQSTPPVAPVASASRPVAAPGPSREPATLAVFPEEAAVVAALDAAGIRLTLIGGSKFETLLGEPQRARVFIERAGAGGAGADVLFLDHPIPDLRLCVSTAASGLNRFQIFIGDQLVSDGEGVQNMSFSVSDRYFVLGIGEAFGEALMKGLGTKRPPC
jgi:hypothetical protein